MVKYISDADIFTESYKYIGFHTNIRMTRDIVERAHWTDLFRGNTLCGREDTRGILFVHGISVLVLVIWYNTSVQDALNGTNLHQLHLAAFLIFFKLVLISLSIAYLKDYIKSRV